jgi:pSer/pThr/pTyr-binding forkhead associated (FHA) protein
MASEQTQCRAYLYTEASGVVYELEDTETQLGRADHNDIVVTQSKSVSGVHARLTIQADHATLTDLNSLNGCVVNGVRIHNS